MKSFDLSLYLVTDSDLALGRDLCEVIGQAVQGGVTIVQLREKELATGAFVELARRVKEQLSGSGVPLIINDRIDVALACDADGVHIGQADMDYATARKLLGYDKIIGLSVESLEDLEKANELDVDYVGISPIFATPTKTDTKKPFGIEGAQAAAKMSTHPTVAIGGMNAQTIAQTIEQGVDGVAVVSAIVSAENPMKSSQELLKIVKNTKNGVL